jgi:hypothetical protein
MKQKSAHASAVAKSKTKEVTKEPVNQPDNKELPLTPQPVAINSVPEAPAKPPVQEAPITQAVPTEAVTLAEESIVPQPDDDLQTIIATEVEKHEAVSERDDKFKRPEISLEDVAKNAKEAKKSDQAVPETASAEVKIPSQPQLDPSDIKTDEPIDTVKNEKTPKAGKQPNELEILWNAGTPSEIPANLGVASTPVVTIADPSQLADSTADEDSSSTDASSKQPTPANAAMYLYTPKLASNSPKEVPAAKLPRVKNDAKQPKEKEIDKEESAPIDTTKLINSAKVPLPAVPLPQEDTLIPYVSDEHLLTTTNFIDNAKMFYLVFYLLGILTASVIGGGLYYFKGIVPVNLASMILSAPPKHEAVSTQATNEKAATSSAKKVETKVAIIFNRANFKVSVLNGSLKSGIALTASNKLKSLGYQIDTIGNATSGAFPQTIVRTKIKTASLAAELIKDLAPDYQATSSADLPDNQTIDAQIIIGKK